MRFKFVTSVFAAAAMFGFEGPRHFRLKIRRGNPLKFAPMASLMTATASIRSLVGAIPLAFLFSSPGLAGTIIVSGDINIGNGIDGSSGASVGDNGTFFKNVLGAGKNIVLQWGALNSSPSSVTAKSAIINYYSSLAGVSVSDTSTPPTAAQLASANLFISARPEVSYSPAEVSALDNFLNGGGTLFFLGDNLNSAAQNAIINSELTALSSSLSILPNMIVDSGFHTATGTAIAAQPLTAGVSKLDYAAVSGIAGGTDLFFATDGTPFIAYETTTRSPPHSLSDIVRNAVTVSSSGNEIAATFKPNFGLTLHVRRQRL